MKISLYLSLGGHFYLKLYHIRVKNKLQKSILFRDGRGMHVSRKRYQNREKLEKWYLNHYDQISSCVIICGKGRQLKGNKHSNIDLKST